LEASITTDEIRSRVLRRGLVMAMHPEPKITVNGRLLTPLQAMTVRNALGCLGAYLLDEDALGLDDPCGVIATGLQRSVREIQALIVRPRFTGSLPEPPDS
jgi:hypothetical protein